MTSVMTRREFLFRKLPGAAMAIASAASLTGIAKEVLAEPIAQKTNRIIRSDEFVRNLLARSGPRFSEAYEKEFADFCLEHSIACDDKKIKEGYMTARFFHELIKNRGILGNNYIKEFERKNVVMLDGKTYPPDEDVNFRSPGRIISDMFSGNPRYAVDGRKMFCFGDCDEYEMAYLVILRATGMEGRIVMTEPVHVNTLVKLGDLELLVDNTRNIFLDAWDCGRRCSEHLAGPGGYSTKRQAKRYVEHINRRTQDDVAVNVFPGGAKRVERKIETAIRKKEKESENEIIICFGDMFSSNAGL